MNLLMKLLKSVPDFDDPYGDTLEKPKQEVCVEHMEHEIYGSRCSKWAEKDLYPECDPDTYVLIEEPVFDIFKQKPMP